jgi:hypothetical protein
MMPGPDVLPTEDDIKKTFFGCQRPDDQSAFIQDAKKLPAAATRAELINFMEIRSTLRSSFPSTDSNSGNNSGNGRNNRDYSRHKNGGGNGDRYYDHNSDSDNDHKYDDDELSSDESRSSESDSNSESDDSRNDDRDFNRNKRNGNRNGGDRNDDQARKRSRDMNKCPFHPEANHTWSDCFGNPNGRNWKPQFAARMADILAKAKSGSNNNKQGGNTNADVHDD